MTSTERMTTFAGLMRAADPAAFDMADALDDADRAAIASIVVDWLRGAGKKTVASLLAWLPDDDWPRVIEATVDAIVADDASLDVRGRGAHVLDHAATQVPDALDLHFKRLRRAKLGKHDLNRWERLLETPATPSRHIAFERGLVAVRVPHPTQIAPPPTSKRLRFGGTSEGLCGLCHRPLHHLITLEQEGLEIATCLSCLGWEQPHGDYALSYRHAGDGSPQALDRLDAPLEPRFPSLPLLETTVALVDVGPRFYVQDWAADARDQNLHRVGGSPTWVQDEEQRQCPSCNGLMDFLMQLDSNLPQRDGHHFMWGSGGLLYVQLCTACRITALLWQCT